MNVRVLVFALLTLAVAACSRQSPDGFEAEGGRRPGVSTENPDSVPEASEPYFADGNPRRIVAQDGAADVVLTLLRDDYLEAEGATATVRSDAGAVATAVFKAHKGEAEVTFRIDRTSTFSIDGATASAPGPTSWRVELVQPTQDDPKGEATGVYLVGNRSVPVQVVMTTSGATVHMAVSGDDLTRDFTLDGDDLRLDGTPLYNNVKNTARPDEGFYAVLCDEGMAEYLLLDGYETGFGAPEAWNFVDGWLVGHIAFESYLVNPENAPWTVWVQRGEGCLRVLDLYHGTSLTARYNRASPGACVIIKVDEGTATLERQPAGFAHPDIFDYELEIAGEGIYDGQSEIYIRDPLYSDFDGNMNAWATRQASRLWR